MASNAESDSIMVYDDHQKYNEWEFIYDPAKDKSRTIGTGNVAVGQQLGQPIGQQGNSPFGQQGNSPFGQQGNSPFGQQGTSPFGQSNSPFGQQQAQPGFGQSPGRR